MIRSTRPSCRASSASSSRPPPRDQRDRALGKAGALARLGHDLREHRVRARGGRRAAQHDRVAGLDRQRGRVHRHVRARLVDDRDHAERHAHLAQLEPVGERARVELLADRVGQRRRCRARRPPSPARAPRRARAGRSAPRRARPRGRPRGRRRSPRGSRRRAPRARRRSPRARASFVAVSSVASRVRGALRALADLRHRLSADRHRGKGNGR